MTEPSLYQRENGKRWLILLGCLLLLAIAIGYALNAGSYHLSVFQIIHVLQQAVLGNTASLEPNEKIVILDFRLPRILLAVLTGISLAISGAVMQALLKNPLVSPFTLGLSSAASFGAAAAIVLGAAYLPLIGALYQNYLIVLAAFILGWLSILLIYVIARMRGSTSATLILSGVVIGYIFQAGVMILKYISNNDKLREITLWLMGGMWGANWGAIIVTAPIVLICSLYLLSKAWDLNALSVGDDIAENVGVNVERLRFVGLMVATLTSSACLAFTGVIGFIGLMGPHIGRMIIGNDNRYLIPCSAMIGAIILLVSDTCARTIMDPVEIPVGVIMYILGGVFFMFLILKGKHRVIS